MRLALFACAVVFASALAEESAVQQLHRLRGDAQSARKNGDKQAHLSAVLKLEEFTHHSSPVMVESAAIAYAETGNDRLALEALQEFAAMGQTDEKLVKGERAELARLGADPLYKSILDRIAANNATISRAEVLATISDAGLLPEDIDYDSTSRTFLVTSVLEKKIVRITRSGEVTDFAKSPSGWPMLAIKIDARRGRVWATEVALDGFAMVPKEAWGRSALLCFELKSGRQLRRIEAGHTSLGDMALSPDGTPIVSDGEGGGIHRLSGERLEAIDDRDFVSPQTPAPIAGTSAVFIPDYTRGIALLDAAKRSVMWLGASGRDAVALSGVDGVYSVGDELILTQNGTSPERVIRLKLNRERTKVLSQDVIEQGERLGDPTHGVIVGHDFYFIANSGWNHLDEHGVINPGEHLSAAMIMRYRLN